MLFLDIEKNVTFTGKMPNEQLPGFYATADMFVGPSIITDSGDTEGLGVVFLEALASGTAVIGSNVGGIPDIIEDGKSGFLVPQKDSKVLADKIIDLLKNPQLQKDFANYGKEHIKKNFSWESIAEKFNELFKSLS
jgi:glycosyltransferase involved in cell wall biosynthesis